MTTLLGTEFLVDATGLPADFFRDAAPLDRLAGAILEAAGCRVVATCRHDFGGGASTLVHILAESNLTLHTWPERGALTVDLFLCRSPLTADRLTDLVRLRTKAERIVVRTVARGEPDASAAALAPSVGVPGTRPPQESA